MGWSIHPLFLTFCHPLPHTHACMHALECDIYSFDDVITHIYIETLPHSHILVWHVYTCAWMCAFTYRQTYTYIETCTQLAVFSASIFAFAKSEHTSTEWCMQAQLFIYIVIHTHIHIQMHLYMRVQMYLHAHMLSLSFSIRFIYWHKFDEEGSSCF